jgi:glucan biosynthesis protein C
MPMLQPVTPRSATDPSLPVAAPTGSGRIMELDAARSMLMLLGLVIHAASPYAAGHSWIVSDGNDQLWLLHLQRLPHMFRMSGFFLLAGFLGTLALNKRGVRDFLGRRTTRLIYPLVTALLTLNALQYWYVHHHIATHCAGTASACAAHVVPGLWVAHLWFLFFLMGYSLLLPALVRICHWTPLRDLARRSAAAHWPLLVSLTVPFAGSLLLKSCSLALPWLYERQLGIGSLFDFMRFGLYFALGVLIASWPLLRQRFVTLPPRTALLLVLAGIAAYVAAAQLATGHGWQARAALVLEYACQSLLTIGAVRLFMLLSHLLPGLATRIADSSYTVYLFHHLLVILTALALVEWPGPAWVKFLLVCTVAGGVSYQLHRRVISRSALLRRLFNGVG